MTSFYISKQAKDATYQVSFMLLCSVFIYPNKQKMQPIRLVSCYYDQFLYPNKQKMQPIRLVSCYYAQFLYPNKKKMQHIRLVLCYYAQFLYPNRQKMQPIMQVSFMPLCLVFYHNYNIFIEIFIVYANKQKKYRTYTMYV